MDAARIRFTIRNLMTLVALIGLALKFGITVAECRANVAGYMRRVSTYSSEAKAWETVTLPGYASSHHGILKYRRSLARYYRMLEAKYRWLSWHPWDFCALDPLPPFPQFDATEVSRMR
jgi:hypothetical protein